MFDILGWPGPGGRPACLMSGGGGLTVVLPVNRQKDTSENITFPQLHWRSAKMEIYISSKQLLYYSINGITRSVMAFVRYFILCLLPSTITYHNLKPQKTPVEKWRNVSYVRRVSKMFFYETRIWIVFDVDSFNKMFQVVQWIPRAIFEFQNTHLEDVYLQKHRWIVLNYI